MLEEDARIVAPQRRAQQADRVLGIARRRHQPAGIMDELHLVGLAVPRIAALEKADGMRSTIGAANLLLVRQRIVPQSLICSRAGSAYFRNWISGPASGPRPQGRRRGRRSPPRTGWYQHPAHAMFFLQAERDRMDAALRADVLARRSHLRFDLWFMIEHPADRGEPCSSLSPWAQYFGRTSSPPPLRPLASLAIASLHRRHRS